MGGGVAGDYTTSNKSYSECGQVFGDEFAAAAVIDRLPQSLVTVNIRGESNGQEEGRNLRGAGCEGDRLSGSSVELGPALSLIRSSAAEFETGRNWGV